MIYFASEFLYHFYAHVNLFCRKHDYDSYCSLDCRFPVYFQPSLVLSGNAARASKHLKTKLFQSVHHKYLCMAFQTIPSKFSCAKFKPSKCFSICVNVLQLMRKYVVFIFQSCWATFTNGLVASSAYPIILQKELAMGFPVPN